MYKIISTKEAEQDLRSIYEYITFSFGMPMIASKLTARLQVKIKSLLDSPKRYKVFDMEPWRSRNLLYFYAENYAIFYIVDDEKNNIWIIRILHKGMDYKRALDESSEHYFVSDNTILERYEGTNK